MNKYFLHIIINMIKKMKEDESASSFDDLLMNQILPDVMNTQQLNQEELNYIINNI